MIDELIESIKETEKRAEEIARASVVSSKEIISQATAKAEQLIIQTNAKLKELERTATATAEDKAKAVIIKVMDDASKVAKDLAVMAESNIDEAIDMVVKKVVGRYASN